MMTPCLTLKQAQAAVAAANIDGYPSLNLIDLTVAYCVQGWVISLYRREHIAQASINRIGVIASEREPATAKEFKTLEAVHKMAQRIFEPAASPEFRPCFEVRCDK